MIQTRRTAKALVSTRRHGPLRNSRAPTEHQRSQKMGKWGSFVGHKEGHEPRFPCGHLLAGSPVIVGIGAAEGAADPLRLHSEDGGPVRPGPDRPAREGR